MITFIDWAAIYCTVASVTHLVSVGIAIFRCRRRDAASRAAVGSPPVTLLRPICGVEPFCADTLGSGFRLDYPELEIIFCAARGDDPAVAIVQRLIADHPLVPARLLIGDDRLSANPKLNNLVKGWRAARHKWIVMADSNVLLPVDSLQRLLGRWLPDTGAVSSLPIGSRPANFWAEVECAFLNTHAARFEYASEALGFGFAQGKTMLFRRDLVERAGGIGVLAADRAEDAAATKMVRAAGRRVRLVDQPFEQPLGRRGFAEVWSRQVRWARLRRHSFFWLFLPESLVGSALPTVCLAAIAAEREFSIAGSVGLLFGVWFGAEAILAHCAGWHLSWRTPAALLVRDLILPALWIASWAGSGFVWRGTAMRAERGGATEFAADLPA